MNKKIFSDIKNLIFGLAAYLFILSISTSILLLLIDTFFPGFVSNYFEMNYLKYLTLFFGLAYIFKPNHSDATSKN